MFSALTVLLPGVTYQSTMIRNVRSNAVGFCGHFPDGAEKVTKTDIICESKGSGCRRQMLGSVNFNAGTAMWFMSGNLCHQIAHHLHPDLPSNRLRDLGAGARDC